MYYGLTATGGDRWERAARPDWTRFVAYGHGCDDDHEVRAASPEVADAYLAYLLEWFVDLEGAVERLPLRPWQATYWKQLPGGFELRFRGAPRESRAPTFPASEFFTREPWWYSRPW